MKRRSFLNASLLGAGGFYMKPLFGNSVILPELDNRKNEEQALSLDLTKVENNAALNALGYENVLFHGADPTGLIDSTTAIQNAINAGYNNSRTVLFPLGTYTISKHLYCYKWWVPGNWPYKVYSLLGENRDGKRPLIKLAVNAPDFNDPANPRPMIGISFFEVAGSGPTSPKEGTIPTDPSVLSSFNPMKGLTGWTKFPMNLFDDQLRGIDFDCSGHSGAIGVYFPSAQKCLLLDVHVNAVGAYAGFQGIPGRNSGAANISVDGGQFGLIFDASEASSTVVGIRLHNQTDSALVFWDFVPAAIIGFEIRKSSSPVITTKNYNGAPNAVGTFCMIDGSIEVGSGTTMIVNSIGKSIYFRNVYAKGPGSFVKSGSQAAAGGTGTWYRVAEYCYTDQTNSTHNPPLLNDKVFSHYSIIDGVKSRIPEPIKTIENNVDPPADYVTKHLYTEIPQLSFSDSSKTINVTDAPYNAVPDTRDNWQAIQDAINDGNRDGKAVFIPRGSFMISKTLTLQKNTKLIGLGCRRNAADTGLAQGPVTVLRAHSSWQKIAGNEAMISTLDDTEAEPFIYGMNLITNSNVIRHVHWKAGRKSTIMNLGFGKGTVVETTVYFSGNGGGRHYLLEPQTDGVSIIHRHVRTVSTTQPLSWYGCNLECGSAVLYNAEFTDSENIRIYGIKREGKCPTCLINNCKNIGIFAQGAMRQGLDDTDGPSYNDIIGNSTGILMPLIFTQQLDYIAPNNKAVLLEKITGQPEVSVMWPEGVSVYKRGEIDDSKMYLRSDFPSDIQKTKVTKTNVYPTVTDGIITIDAEEKVKSIRLYNLNGTMIRQWTETNLINITSQAPGLYLLKLSCYSGNENNFKIIKH